MAVIFAFSSRTPGQVPTFGPYDALLKKLSHMVGYALLAVAYLHGIGREKPRAPAWAWLLAVAYGITDEFHQSFVPGRGPLLWDVGIDSLGALFGLLLWFIPRTQARNRQSLPRS
ncbi:MAG: VanZ family protein [Chloroflexota bacterium]|nr:MAG: VanZ family protein [Chloroflexota bacterium]